MTNVTVKESSAGQAVGTNLMSGNRLQIAPSRRLVRRIGVVGSAAIGDAAVDLFYGNDYIGTFYNSSAGANLIPLDSKDMMPVVSSKYILPGEPLNIFISDAGGTNVIAVTLEIVEF